MYMTSAGVPTCITFLGPTKVGVGHTTSALVVYDAETGQEAVAMDSMATSGVCSYHVCRIDLFIYIILMIYFSLWVV